MVRRTSEVCLALLFGALAGGAEAASLPADGGAGEIAFVAGGIGETEQAQLSEREKEFNLRTEYFRWPANLEEDLPVSRWLDKD